MESYLNPNLNYIAGWQGPTNLRNVLSLTNLDAGLLALYD
jgi:hypothetical protein